MAFRWQVAALLLLASCSSGSTVPATHPSPTPPPPTPSIDPIRVEPARDLAIRYPRSGAGMLRYALARRDSVIATMPGGDTQVQILGRTAFLTLTWVAADTGTRLTATVDSIVPDSGLTGLAMMLDSARGSRWTAFRRPEGHLVALAGGTRSLVADQIRDQLQLLFPLLPPEGLRPGATWTDSTKAVARVSAFEATEAALTASRAASMTTASGTLPLVVVRTRTATAEGMQFGQPMTLRATGSDTLTYQIAPDGRVLSAEGVRLTDLVIDLPSSGQSVPAQERSGLRMILLH
jgi:hypothetical protein